MSNSLDIPALERPSFFDGQRLTADDLSEVQDYHRQLRWLHNRSLHNWGIAFGYAVTGVRGGRSVTVGAGYALDCKGRELVLGEALALAIPPVSGARGGGPATYYLVATYAEDEDLTPEMRKGTCGTAGAVRRPEEPLIRWVDPDEGFRHGIDVVLASIKVENCQLAEDISRAERRDALPAQQPYVAAGATLAGETEWRLWPNEANPIGVATTVPTNSAGFRTTPLYQAHVMGERVFEISGAGDDVRLTGVVDGYAQIRQPTAANFELVTILPLGIITGSSTTVLNPPQVLTLDFLTRLREADQLGWHVAWMGLEG